MTADREKMPELKECPFCGGDAHVSRMRDESLWSHATVEKTSVWCGECDVHTEYTEEGQEPEAIELWNTRALTQPPSGEVPDAMTYAGQRSMAITSEWARGWDDCLAALHHQGESSTGAGCSAADPVSTTSTPPAVASPDAEEVKRLAEECKLLGDRYANARNDSYAAVWKEAKRNLHAAIDAIASEAARVPRRVERAEQFMASPEYMDRMKDARRELAEETARSLAADVERLREDAERMRPVFEAAVVAHGALFAVGNEKRPDRPSLEAIWVAVDRALPSHSQKEAKK